MTFSVPAPIEPRWQGRLHRVATVPSTMDLARHSAQAGAPAGQGYEALAQQAGRGRSGRVWQSEPGDGLYLSVVLWPVETWPIASLSPAMALAVVAWCHAQGVVHARLKWPNDVLVQGDKLAGLLLERGEGPQQRPYVLLGIGLNWRRPTLVGPAADAAALAPIGWDVARGRPLRDEAERQALTASLHKALGLAYEAWQREGFGPQTQAFDAAHAFAGAQALAWESGHAQPCVGRVGAVRADGCLALHTAEGVQWLMGARLRLA